MNWRTLSVPEIVLGVGHTERKPERLLWGLLCRRGLVVPSLRGWLVLAGSGCLILLIALRTLHPFFARTAPVDANVLVVEGWIPDYAMEAAKEEFERGDYQKLYVVGGPLQRGSPLAKYKTYAELGAACLKEQGLSSKAVQAVPSPIVRQDRTYTAGLVLRDWMIDEGTLPTGLNLVTHGVHARRSRLLFQMAFGDNVEIGIIAIPSRDYDPDHWWRYSEGVREVIGEMIAYVYARLLFSPPDSIEQAEPPREP